MGFRTTLNVQKFKVALNPMYRILLNFAKHCLSCLSKFYNKKNFTVPFLKYKRLKLKLKVFLAGHSVATVTVVSRKQYQRVHQSGADPGFFLGGGAPLRIGVTNTNKPHTFLQSTSCIRKPQVISGKGAHPLHPPSRSAPAVIGQFFDAMIVASIDKEWL